VNHTKKRERRNTAAGALLLIFLALFVGFLAYITSSSDTTTNVHKEYFENLDFALEAGKMWHVGVPVAFDGTLHLSLMSNDSVRVYAKTQNGYLVDSVSAGHKDYFIHVTASMGVVEVAVTNPGLEIVAVSELTCVLAA
jgi:amino acid permease